MSTTVGRQVTPQGSTSIHGSSRPFAARVRRRMGQLLVWSLVLATTLGFGAIGYRWATYRFSNVVSHDAQVMGTVTLIGARLDGRVAGLEVEPGRPVRKGAVLARMEDAHLVAAVDQAQALLESASRAVEVERSAIEQERRRFALQVAEADAELDVARAELEAARATLQRWEKETARLRELEAARRLN